MHSHFFLQKHTENNVHIVCFINHPDARVSEQRVEFVTRGTRQDTDCGVFGQLNRSRRTRRE